MDTKSICPRNVNSLEKKKKTVGEVVESLEFKSKYSESEAKSYILVIQVTVFTLAPGGFSNADR